MKDLFRKSALALAFIGGVALVSAPATAGSIHKRGDFGGTWSRIGPSDQYRNKRYSNRSYNSYRSYRGPGYAYGYGPRYGGYYDAPYGYDRPGIGLGFTIR